MPLNQGARPELVLLLLCCFSRPSFQDFCRFFFFLIVICLVYHKYSRGSTLYVLVVVFGGQEENANFKINFKCLHVSYRVFFVNYL